MKAVILAGGKGTRLAPYTTSFPKPLVPIGRYPIVEILIRQLVAEGIDEVALTVGYLAELIRAYFLQRPKLVEKAHLSYVSETRPTGTAGSLAFVPGLSETFLVMNGDVLTTLKFRDLVEYHRRCGGVLTIATHRKVVKIDLGVIREDTNNLVTDYLEKPELDYLVSMGIYVYEPKVLQYIEPDEHLDFPDLVLRLLRCGERVVTYHSEDLWLDIGRPEDYEKATQEFTARQAEFIQDLDLD